MPAPRKPRVSKAKSTCKFHCCNITDKAGERIKASVEEGRGQSMFANDSAFGPNCRCGLPRKPPGLAKHVADDGLCVVHPDKPAQPWVIGVSHG